MSAASDPLDRLLPHRPPLRLVREVLEREADRALCRGVIPVDCPGAEEGRAPSVLGLELGAQSAALFAGSEGESEDEGPAIGYLVLIRKAEMLVPSLPVEVPLRVEIRRAGKVAGLSLIDIEVALEKEPDRVVVRGQIGTILTDQRAPVD